jgi:hypothetical protein
MDRKQLRTLALAALLGVCSATLSAQERPPREPPPRGQQPPLDGGQRYSIEQAVSDRAQLHAIAFNALAFLTGDFGCDPFLPPGKVSDYFGFQYMRDIDSRGGGHNTSFLTRIAYNMLTTLSEEQKAQLIQLATKQDSRIRQYAEMRLPLIMAFRRNLQGELPRGSNGLSQKGVVRYSADLYALDGELAFERAQVMGAVLRSLNDTRRARLSALKFGDAGAGGHSACQATAGRALRSGDARTEGFLRRERQILQTA